MVQKVASPRHSNFELLRILCMFGVLMGHVLISLYQEQIHSQDWSLPNQGRVFLLNACAVALNCFVMISGYFTIRLSWRKILRYIGMCFWYAVILWLCFGGSWHAVLFPITESGLWFLPCYLGLVLISPLLNAGLINLENNQLRNAVAVLLLADVYLGYMHQNVGVGTDGYGIFHLISIYSLGYLMARQPYSFKYPGTWCIVCFVLMVFLHAGKMLWAPVALIYSLHYNSPILILASLLVFMWAKNLSLHSNVINWIASSVFTVYLVHCNASFSPSFWNYFFGLRDNTVSSFLTVLEIALSILLFYMVCILLDKLRIFVFGKIEAGLSFLLDKTILDR